MIHHQVESMFIYFSKPTFCRWIPVIMILFVFLKKSVAYITITTVINSLEVSKGNHFDARSSSKFPFKNSVSTLQFRYRQISSKNNHIKCLRRDNDENLNTHSISKRARVRESGKGKDVDAVSRSPRHADRKLPKTAKRAPSAGHDRHVEGRSKLHNATITVQDSFSESTLPPTFDWPPAHPAGEGLPWGPGWRAIYMDEKVYIHQ